MQTAGEGQVTKGLLVNSTVSLSLLLSVVRSHWRVSDGRGAPELWDVVPQDANMTCGREQVRAFGWTFVDISQQVGLH